MIKTVCKRNFFKKTDNFYVLLLTPVRNAGIIPHVGQRIAAGSPRK
jgi:hypothetical protein